MTSTTSDIINFFVIGAQKAGTTSLHFYLDTFQDITLPTSKESPRFCLSSPESSAHNLLDIYQVIKPRSILGKVTPQYSCYLGSAQNIYKYNSSSKIILIVRNPIDRAYSHYMMNKRRGKEKLSFEERVVSILSSKVAFDDFLISNNDINYELNKILLWGCYGEILSKYSKHFSEKSILIINSIDLENNPSNVIRDIRFFLDLPISQENKNIVYDRYHSGGNTTKLPRLENFTRLPIVQKIKEYTPKRWRQNTIIKSLKFNYEIWNVKKSIDKQIPLSSLVYEELVEFYKADIEKNSRLEQYLETWFRKDFLQEGISVNM